MNFDDSPAEAAFRAEARAWIAANGPHELIPELERSSFGRVTIESVDPLEAARAWQRRKFAAGWACLHWPRRYGGRDASPIERVIFTQEEGLYAQLTGLFVIGHGMCGPTLMRYASEAQKERFLPPLASGDEIWCQLFSEPAAGSDLAGIRMRAERDGDGWRINGQKIWTSGAHLADFGIILTRTDPSRPKHQGLTMFFVDMRTPGIEVRPIRQANGQSHFNEVFLTDVAIPDAQRLGPVDDGWTSALTMLMHERATLGTRIPTGFPELLDYCARLEIDGRPAIEDRAVRARLADFAIRDSGLRHTALRTISALSKGGQPGPENSIGKLVAGSTMQEIAMFALDLQGQAGGVIDPVFAEDGGRFQAMLLRSPGTRIEGGTDEILRNIIAERVLGLPADIRVDKTVPFEAIPTGR